MWLSLWFSGEESIDVSGQPGLVQTITDRERPRDQQLGRRQAADKRGEVWSIFLTEIRDGTDELIRGNNERGQVCSHVRLEAEEQAMRKKEQEKTAS